MTLRRILADPKRLWHFIFGGDAKVPENIYLSYNYISY